MTDKSDCQPQVADNLPRDATGKVIPFDTKRLYDRHGSQHYVSRFEYIVATKEWSAGLFIPEDMFCRELYLDRPDSWEQLLKDLDKAAATPGNKSTCSYLTGDAGTRCEKCKSYKRDRWCAQTMTADIARRVRALREADENAD